MKRLTDDDLVLGDDYALYHDGQPFTGISYDTRPDGSLWSETAYTRGWRNGPSRTLYPDGRVKSQSHYKMALAHGWKEEFYPDGRPRSRTLNELGVRVQEQEFDRDGNLIREWTIAPDSKEYRRLEANRRNEEQRLERIYRQYGRPDANESQVDP